MIITEQILKKTPCIYSVHCKLANSRFLGFVRNSGSIVEYQTLLAHAIGALLLVGPGFGSSSDSLCIESLSQAWLGTGHFEELKYMAKIERKICPCCKSEDQTTSLIGAIKLSFRKISACGTMCKPHRMTSKKKQKFGCGKKDADSQIKNFAVSSQIHPRFPALLETSITITTNALPVHHRAPSDPQKQK